MASCCIAIRISHGNPAMHLQFLQPGSVIQFDRGGSFRKCLQRSDEIARGGDGKMRQQGGAIGPLFKKHQPQRIFAIDMDGMRNAAGLGARAMDVLETQYLRTSSKLSARVVTLPVTTIMLSSPFSQLLWRGIAGGAQVQRLLRPAFQRGMSGIGQHINAALGAIEPTIDIMQQDFSGIGNFSPQILHTSRPA